MKLISVDQISSRGADVLTPIRTTPQNVREVLPPELCHSESLVFLSKTEHFNTAVARGARVFVIHDVLYKIIQNDLPESSAAWTTPNIQQAMIATLGLFDRNRDHLRGIHPAAYVHPSVKVGSDCYIGPYAVIEAGAKIGDSVFIFPHAFIGANCEIGNRCQIGPHTTIGSDGFGFFTDKKLNHHKVPQIGKVVIEDDCEIGAQCAIDRATLTETRIGRGSKLDNFCHIAHNVKIGENAAIAAGFIVAGSTVIGKNFMASGGVHVLGHLRITDNVILTARAGVLQDIEIAGMYGGYPLEAHKDSIKTLMSVPDIKKMRKQIKKIINHLQIEIED